MRRSFLFALAPLALLTACAAPLEETDPVDEPAPSGDYALRLTVDRGDGSAAEEWTLSCLGEVAGSHPDAGAACTHLSGIEDPFAPVEGVCTEQYGGPQTAHVTGRWAGQPVDLQLSRTDGCQIARWDAMGPLLPIPVGDQPED
ncbi:UNVERIFIED_ORG: subtilase-type protease inhibitor [Bacillus sp. AZ43]